MEPVYTIVDIETTGNGRQGNRITEIALYNIEDGQITNSFCSLINPGCPIPEYITGLTGITNAMVRHAPSFEQVMAKIDAFCSNRIFVAHSVNFDYPIVREEFARCGRSFQRKKLCTVRLSRKVFPGLKSYSLGKLCSSLNIPLNHRHRAGGDAHATALLFQQILNDPKGPETIHTFLKVRSKEATLPPHLPKDLYDQLPEAPGIYFFKDQLGKIIYIGKAINLKKRVLGHFYDRSEKERQLCRETANIAFELSGSEILALLMETVAIKKHFPAFNRAQKSVRPSFGLCSYQDRDGIVHLAVTRLRKGQQSFRVFPNEAEARLYVEALCETHGLCAKYCHLQEGVSQCSHFRVSQCLGVCRGAEPVSAYNLRVQQAIFEARPKYGDYVVFQKGRSAEERGLIWISDGRCKGFGFVPSNFTPESASDLASSIPLQAQFPESDRLIESFISKHPEYLIELQN